MRAELVKMSVKRWMDRCSCEVCGASHPHLYLKPTTTKLRSLVSYYLWLAERFQSEDDLIIYLRNQILFDHNRYDYTSTAPIICKSCAEKAGLIVHEDYRAATNKVLTCSQCQKVYDPFNDHKIGAMFEIDGEILCDECAEQIISEQIGLALENSPKDRFKQVRQSDRVVNSEILADYLTNKQCNMCGETDIGLLELVKTDKSPDRSISQWKRDCTPETFRERLSTCLIICRGCRAKMDPSEEIDST